MILATSLFVILVTALAGAYLYGQKSSINAGDRTKALLLAEDGLEAVVALRSDDFQNLTPGTYGLSFVGGVWSLVAQPDTDGVFYRTVSITQATTSDLDRRNVTVSVSWNTLSTGTSTVELSRHFTNWGDMRYWYTPGLITTLDLPAGGHKVQVQDNYAYVIGHTSPVLYIIDVTSSTSPQLISSFSLVGTLQNLFVKGNYVYIVSDDNNRELQIVNVTNKNNPSLASFYNAPSSADGMGLYVMGSTLYMTRQNSGQNEFLVLNVSNPNNVSALGSLNLGATGFEVVASGTYAYLASDNNTEELQIVNISNPNSPVMAGTFNLSLKEQNRSSAVSLKDTTLYLGQGKDLYILDVSSVASPVQKSNTSVADYFNDVSVELGNRRRFLFVATSDINKEFKVYNVGSTTWPYVYGSSLDLTGNSELFGVSYATSTNLVYAVSHSPTNTFFVMSP
jgi:hypothetical protein